MRKDQDNANDFDYTIVMDASYIAQGDSGAPNGTEVRREDTSGGASLEKSREAIDALYGEYEKMCREDPSMYDADDAYPHSYQWRMADRYDPSKTEVVRAAVRQGVRIADTEEYLRYTEEISRRSFEPVSWD